MTTALADLTKFQSTPSLRKETQFLAGVFKTFGNFNPLLPCGRRRFHWIFARKCSRYFNPLLPCGRRLWALMANNEREVFQSTPSLRKETVLDNDKQGNISISIHSFLAEGDSVVMESAFIKTYFNPLLPCGRRPQFCT